jgi:hypothetical protein
MSFIHEFNIIYLFSIYITLYYKPILIYRVMEDQKLWGFLWTLGMLWGVTYPKFRLSSCRNKSQKFKPCRDKKCNI